VLVLVTVVVVRTTLDAPDETVAVTKEVDVKVVGAEKLLVTSFVEVNRCVIVTSVLTVEKLTPEAYLVDTTVATRVEVFFVVDDWVTVWTFVVRVVKVVVIVVNGSGTYLVLGAFAWMRELQNGSTSDQC
jgi:hypothetical protein